MARKNRTVMGRKDIFIGKRKGIMQWLLFNRSDLKVAATYTT